MPSDGDNKMNTMILMVNYYVMEHTYVVRILLTVGHQHICTVRALVFVVGGVLVSHLMLYSPLAVVSFLACTSSSLEGMGFYMAAALIVGRSNCLYTKHWTHSCR